MAKVQKVITEEQKAEVQEYLQRARTAMDAIADYDQARVRQPVPGSGVGYRE